MTAHVYNAIIIANDLNIMVSLNYSIVSWLMRAIGNRFQFAVSCTAFALLVRFVFCLLQLEVCLHVAWNLKWASNRIRYTAQITMKIYELFSQCEFISWPRTHRPNDCAEDIQLFARIRLRHIQSNRQPFYGIEIAITFVLSIKSIQYS